MRMAAIPAATLISLLACMTGAAEVVWPVSTPDREGFRPHSLEDFQKDLASRATKAVLVARHGNIVLEWYREGESRSKKQGTASLAKALIGGTSLLGAMQAGHISPEDLASKFIPAWRDDPQKRLITIRELATHTSGLDDAEKDDFTA